MISDERLNSSPVVSVITITKDNAEGLRKTLESIRAAHDAHPKAHNFEVVVVDGVSTDHTADVIAQFADLPLSYESEPDRGIYDAMNKGTKRARGEYLQYLNAGDVLSDVRTFEYVNDVVQKPPNSRLPIWIVGRAFRVAKLNAEFDCIPYRFWDHALGIRPHAHQAIFFRRAFVELVGGYSEEFDFAGDFDLVMKAGALEEPHYLDCLVATFEGGGVSDIRAQDIPRLMHNVRVARLHLSGEALKLDEAWTRFQETDNLDTETPEIRMYGLKRRAEHEGIVLRRDMHWDVHNT